MSMQQPILCAVRAAASLLKTRSASRFGRLEGWLLCSQSVVSVVRAPYRAVAGSGFATNLLPLASAP